MSEQEKTEALIKEMIKKLTIVLSPDWRGGETCLEVKLFFDGELISSDSCPVE